MDRQGLRRQGHQNHVRSLLNVKPPWTILPSLHLPPIFPLLPAYLQPVSAHVLVETSILTILSQRYPQPGVLLASHPSNTHSFDVINAPKYTDWTQRLSSSVIRCLVAYKLLNCALSITDESLPPYLCLSIAHMPLAHIHTHICKHKHTPTHIHTHSLCGCGVESVCKVVSPCFYGSRLVVWFNLVRRYQAKKKMMWIITIEIFIVIHDSFDGWRG